MLPVPTISKQAELLNHISFIAAPYRDDDEHHLRDIEGVSPVMVSHVSVVLLDAQQPPAQRRVVDVEPLYQI